MRVLLVDHAPIVGGVEMMIRDLLSALTVERVSPMVVTDTASPMRGRFSATVPELALPLTRLKGNRLAGVSLLSSAVALARAARQTQADVVQTFTARTHLIGSLAGRLARVPVVWRVNDDTLPHGLARMVGRVPRRIIAVSAHLQQHYAGALHVTDLIPDGVPLGAGLPRAVARQALGLPEDALVIALVARLVRWKGQAVFLRALAEVARMYPRAHGLVVGSWSAADKGPGPLGGGEAYAQELEALAESLGLTRHVTFTGHVDPAATAFAAADIVAHTSVLPEPFGRVIVEAMAAGRPVVAARAGGAIEIVREGETGQLVPPSDTVALAAAMCTLAADAGLRQRLGQAGRLRAEEEYALPVMAERFTRVWAEAAR